jgi:hypothetical protein
MAEHGSAPAGRIGQYRAKKSLGISRGFGEDP